MIEYIFKDAFQVFTNTDKETDCSKVLDYIIAGLEKQEGKEKLIEGFESRLKELN